MSFLFKAKLNLISQVHFTDLGGGGKSEDRNDTRFFFIRNPLIRNEAEFLAEN